MWQSSLHKDFFFNLFKKLSAFPFLGYIPGLFMHEYVDEPMTEKRQNNDISVCIYVDQMRTIHN